MVVVASAPIGAVRKVPWRWGRGLIFVNLLVVVLAILSIWENYLIHRDAANFAVQNTARLLSHDLHATFDKLDLALLTLKDEAERQGGPIDWAAVGAIAQKQFKRYPRLGFLGIADPTGRVVAGAGTAQVDISHRNHFNVLRNDPDAGLVISKPLVAHDNQWSIILARRVNQPSGQFAGVLFAIVSLATLQDQFASIDVGRDGVISLRGLDHSIVARFPPPEAVGLHPGETPSSQELREQLEKYPNNGLFTAAGSDKINRIWAYERIATYPFFVFVGMSRASVFYHWQLEALVTVLLSAIIVITSAFLARGWRREDADLKRIFDLQNAALQDSQEQLGLAVDGAELGNWAFDIAKVEVVASDRAKAVLGILPGHSIPDRGCLDTIHPDDRDFVSSALHGSIERGDKFDLRARVIWPDGSLHWVHSVGRRVEGAGANGKLLGIIQDISAEINDLEALKDAKRNAEDSLKAREITEGELRTLTVSLEQRVDEEVARRESAQQRLAHAQRLEAVGQLAGGIAHDFNNVIQVVQGCAELIEAERPNSDQTRHLAGVILEASARGSTVTQRLLAFSRRSDLAAELIDVKELLESLHVILTHTLGTGIAIDVEILHDLPRIVADKAQLETVLVNIAVNARDAMNDTGIVRISTSVENGQDSHLQNDFAHLPPGDYLCITTSDNGPGMTPEVLARASEPFFTTKAVGKGTGLGLAMAKGFAEQSGGAFDIETELGRGTTVKLWFPVARPGLDTGRVSDAKASETQRRGSANILIVDDDSLVLETLVRQMQAQNFIVRQAKDAKSALAKLDDDIALLVTDLSMPEMDGLALIREIHSRKPDLPTILLTGFLGKAVEIEPSSTLVVLRKPVSADELAEQIGKMLIE